MSFGARALIRLGALKHNFVVHCAEQIELLESCAGGSVVAWLKFDTGMNRLGFPPPDVRELTRRMQHIAAVSELRLMTHLSSADELDKDTTQRQLRRFQSLAEGFAGAVSIANSAAVEGRARWLQRALREQNEHDARCDFGGLR